MQLDRLSLTLKKKVRQTVVKISKGKQSMFEINKILNKRKNTVFKFKQRYFNI